MVRGRIKSNPFRLVGIGAAGSDRARDDANLCDLRQATVRRQQRQPRQQQDQTAMATQSAGSARRGRRRRRPHPGLHAMHPQRQGGQGRARRAGAPRGRGGQVVVAAGRAQTTGRSASAHAAGAGALTDPPEQRRHPLRRPRNHGLVALDHDRTLHEFGMLEQERDHRLRRRAVLGRELQFLEPPVPAHQLRGWRVEDRDNPLERRAMQRSFEILDGVELDTLRAQQLQRTARISSARVVIQDDLVHGATPTDFSRRAALPGTRRSPMLHQNGGRGKARR